MIPWLIINKEGPKKHPWITEEERTYILSGQPEQELKTEDKGKSWGELLRVKKNWSVILGRFFLDPIWWMFVTFLPLYLADVFHLNIKEVAFSAWVPYVGAALGSIAGGWYSGWLINRGHTVNYARKAAMLLGGIIIIPSILAAIMSTTAPVAIVFMALVLGGFQFFMTNLQTIPSDLHICRLAGRTGRCFGRIRYYPGNPFCQLYYELDIIIQSVGSFGAAIAVFHLPDSRRD